ncbi:GNAT family N-acetyltransferase [Micromonospora sp. WMMD710]|uniref:GNAT family N-acetyltransferase n=1 Tax=Micromonospora sp. WMMD710 TaxID=3016085 RepID=UPI002416DC3C|nr:GNAT family N-acetyltransferase [Micromonospora sp. WMMD710]MDG4757480.1 GNAT family N-acetyltransferase [Micromonospora sp. WMMD710]
MTTIDADVLDNPAWTSLTGPHAHVAEVRGRAARYPSEVSPFHALADPTDPSAWADLAALVGPDASVLLPGGPDTAPPGWEMTGVIPGVQLVAAGLRAEPDPEAVVLTRADVPEMLDLVRRTEPGPFLTRTIELGPYLGIRRDGSLVAMAGERMRPPGWAEISAVCTDPAYRGHGLATRLIRAVAAGVQARGETPFLHAATVNTSAIRLYEAMGFTLRRHLTFGRYREIGAPERQRR